MSFARFTRAWYAQEFLRELVLAYPVYAILIGRAGVTPLGLSLLLAAWSATAIVSEVPTGTLADRLPRRSILVAGQLLKACCFLIWWWAPSFAGFLAGFVAWGIAGSLRSGAAEALLHDTLAAHGEAGRFSEVYGRSEAAASLAVVCAMALGGWASETGFELPLMLSAAAPLAAATVTLLFIPEPTVRDDTARHEPYLATLGAGLSEVRRSAKLRRPLLYLCTAALAYEIGEEYFGPFLEEAGFTLIAIGLINALANLARAGGAFVAHRLTLGRRRQVPVLYLAGGVALGSAALSTGWWTIALLTLFVALTIAAKVLVVSELQHAIEDRARATVTSVAGLGQELAGLPLFFALGGVATLSSWSRSFALLALGLVAVALLVANADRVAGTREH